MTFDEGMIIMRASLKGTVPLRATMCISAGPEHEPRRDDDECYVTMDAFGRCVHLIKSLDEFYELYPGHRKD